jgi:hypothetical protein
MHKKIEKMQKKQVSYVNILSKKKENSFICL